MEGAKKNPDRMNTIAIVTVGLTGAVLVYLSIVGIEAWYLNETSVVDQVAKFGKQDDVRKTLKSEQNGKITEPRLGTAGPGGVQLYTIGIDAAKDLVVRDAKVDPSFLVPAVGKSDKPTIEPAFGRPRLLVAPVAPPAPIDPTAPVPGTTPAVPGAMPPAVPGAMPPVTPGTAPAPGTVPAAPATAPATTPAGASPVITPAPSAPTPAAGH